MKKLILVINSGSATLKFKIFNGKNFEVEIFGIMEKIGSRGSFLRISNSKKELFFKKFKSGIKNHRQALKVILNNLGEFKNDISVIGHRVVHGGSDFIKPTIINKSVLKKLETYNELAPLHNPVNISCIHECLKRMPGIKNVAVFDTAFYSLIPDYAYTYSIPYQYSKKFKIRKYGFHGISHSYVASQVAKKVSKPLSKLNLITCHLGSGCSVTAIKKGVAVDTSMGFTPLEGLTMGTRSGDLDASIPLFLSKKLKLGIKKVDEILNNESGIKGLFGSNDMRDILIAAGYKIRRYKTTMKFNANDRKRAKLTLNIFIYDVLRYIGSYSLILGNVDYVVFTAGIGERNSTIRSLVIDGCKKTIKRNKFLVVPTNEELMIAKEVSK